MISLKLETNTFLPQILRSGDLGRKPKLTTACLGVVEFIPLLCNKSLAEELDIAVCLMWRLHDRSWVLPPCYFLKLTVAPAGFPFKTKEWGGGSGSRGYSIFNWLIDQDVIVGQYLLEWAVREPSLFLAMNLAQFQILGRWRGHRSWRCCHRHLLGAQHQAMLTGMAAEDRGLLAAQCFSFSCVWESPEGLWSHVWKPCLEVMPGPT